MKHNPKRQLSIYPLSSLWEVKTNLHALFKISYIVVQVNDLFKRIYYQPFNQYYACEGYHLSNYFPGTDFN